MSYVLTLNHEEQSLSHIVVSTRLVDVTLGPFGTKRSQNMVTFDRTKQKGELVVIRMAALAKRSAIS